MTTKTSLFSTEQTIPHILCHILSDNHHPNPSKTELPQQKKQTAEPEHGKGSKLAKLISEEFGLTVSPHAQPVNYSSSD